MANLEITRSHWRYTKKFMQCGVWIRPCGENYPQALEDLVDVAKAYGSIGNYKMSLDMLEDLHVKRIKLLVENHLATLEVLDNLAIAT